MYFVRTPCEWGMDAISATLTFLWEVVGYVEGLFFKDLKQTMKKEQCEVKLLVTASMPGRDMYNLLRRSWDPLPIFYICYFAYCSYTPQI